MPTPSPHLGADCVVSTFYLPHGNARPVTHSYGPYTYRKAAKVAAQVREGHAALIARARLERAVIHVAINQLSTRGDE